MEPTRPAPSLPDGVRAAGRRVTTVAGIVLAVSAFTGWYTTADSEPGPTLAVIGWHVGVLGKLVFVIGLALVVLALLRPLGLVLPPAVPESLVAMALGALATVFLLIRLIDVPEAFLPATGRGAGIWISLVAAIAGIVGGLLEAFADLDR